MQQTQQGICTTNFCHSEYLSSVEFMKESVTLTPESPYVIPDLKKSQELYIKNFNNTDHVYSYQTGHFPVTSRHSKKYLIIFMM